MASRSVHNSSGTVRIVDSDTGNVVSTRSSGSASSGSSGSASRGSTVQSVSTPIVASTAAPVSAGSSDRVKTSGATTGNTRSDIRKVPTSMAEDDGRIVTTKDGETVQLVSVGYNKIDHDLMRRDTSKANGTAQKNGYTVYYDDLGYATKAVLNKAPGYTYVDGQKVYGDDGGIRDSGGYAGSANYAGSAGSGSRSAVYGRDYTPSAYTPAAYQEPETVDLSAQKADARRSAQAQKVDHVDTEPFKSYLDQWLASTKESAQASVDNTVRRGTDALTRAQEDAQEGFNAQIAQANRDEALALDNHALYASARGDRGGIGAAQYDAIQNTAARNRQTVEAARQKLSTDTARQIEDLRANGEFEKADAVLKLTQQHLSQLQSLEQWGMQQNTSIDEFNAQIDQWLQGYLGQLEQIERNANQWERQFAAQQQQYADQQQQWALQWEQQQRQYADQLAQQQASQDQWERQFAAQQQQYADQQALKQAQWEQSLKEYEDSKIKDQRSWDFTQQQYADQQAQQARNNDFQERQYEDTKAQDAKELASSQVMAMLKLGITPDSSLLSAAGIDKSYADLYASAVRAQQAASASGGSSRSSGSSSRSSSSRSSSSGSSKTATPTGAPDYASLADAGATDYGSAYGILRGAGYGVTDSEKYAKYFDEVYYGGSVSLSQSASAMLNAIQYDMQRRGSNQITDQQQQMLTSARRSGRITEQELNIILNRLGI